MSRPLVVEADGGSRGNPGPAGYGALVRDAQTGALLAEVAESIPLATNNVAEYEGLVAGLKAAVAIDPDCTIEVRMDSRLVVEQMSGRWSIKHEDMRRLAALAREVIPSSRVRYTWIPRAENSHADRLANAAMDAGTGSTRRMRLTSTRRPDQPAPGTGDVGADGGSTAVAGRRRSPVADGFAVWSVEAVDLGEPTTVILVRHGRTDDTDQHRARGGGTDGPALNIPGQRQAGQLARLLAEHAQVDRDAAAGSPDSPSDSLPDSPAVAPAKSPAESLLGTRPVAVVASPLLRSRQTANVLAEALGLEPQFEGDWAEVSLGDWDGLGYAEMAAGWPDTFRDWRRSTAVAPPNGESLDEVAKRVGAACDRLVTAYPGRTVVVVSHTAPIRTVLARALAAGPAALWRLRVDPTAISVVRFWADGGCEVATVNSAAHLR
jgi:broad specificity phosphatase PhoE/ribonuclease HI